MNHPAHVHYFKNFIREMQKRGHEILITASEKDLTYRLLDLYGFDYVKVGSYGKSIFQKLINIPILDYSMYRVTKKFRPDLFLGFGSIRAAHVSKILRKPCIALDDTEHAKWEHILYCPFTDTILTPDCFTKNFGRKHIRYRGYTELAYLHPNRFTPNPAVLAEIGLTVGDPFIIVRFVSWHASHDVRQHGIRDKVRLVKALEQYGRVLITSEGALPPELEQYRMRISPEKIHDLLYYATLYIGEGATMASEAAVLGTHAIYINTLRLGYTDEEEEKYDLVYTFSDPREMETEVLSKAVDLLNDPDLRVKGKRKRQTLLEDKIDVTAFMTWFIENYPGSVKRITGQLHFQEQFRMV
ncbi:hypothetical protein ASZ90_015769 [hydrocarbon metagenome]|uniref:DUF354 domain-containing protein n=1 Tax=hydrocarbon metagenome TaxID=938273 RepID=A0A0W8F115_9ZZZZ